MGLLGDTFTLFKRDMLIFKANIRTNLIRAIIFPLFLLLIFGSIGSNYIFHIPVGVVNYANTPQSNQFVSALTAQGTLSIQQTGSESAALDMLRSGNIDLVVVILPNFPNGGTSSPSVEVYYSNEAYSVAEGAVATVTQAAAKFGSKSFISGGSSPSTGYPSSISSSSSIVRTNAAYGIDTNYTAYLAGGIIVMIAAFGSIFGGGMSIITDRQLGNLKSFLISPINKTSIVLGKIAYGTAVSIIYGLVGLALALAIGVGVAMGALGVLWIIIILLFISVGFSSITVVLSSRISRMETYPIVAQLIALPLWFLSGAFFPISGSPPWLQDISVYDPMRYASEGIRSVMIAGYYPASLIIKDLLALSIFSIAGFVLGLILFKSTID